MCTDTPKVGTKVDIFSERAKFSFKRKPGAVENSGLLNAIIKKALFFNGFDMGGTSIFHGQVKNIQPGF